MGLGGAAFTRRTAPFTRRTSLNPLWGFRGVNLVNGGVHLVSAWRHPPKTYSENFMMTLLETSYRAETPNARSANEQALDLASGLDFEHNLH